MSGDVLTSIAAGSGGSSGGGGSLGNGGGGGDAPVHFDGAVTSMASGQGHTCLIRDAKLYCFGNGSDGALGSGELGNRTQPQRVDARVGYEEVVAGARMTCVLREGGIVECVGGGTSGQLGRGSFTDSGVFERVDLPGRAILVDAGYDHVCGILEDRTLWCWGANAEGQLAQNDPFPEAGVPSAVPVQVAAPIGWKTVSGGQGHTCGIQEDGTLWCWGRNSAKELGQGPNFPLQVRVPTQVETAADWLQVAAGQNHTCGLRAGGLVQCWGDNSSGQLGTGDGIASDVPVTVVESGARAISLDTFHTCVLSASGVQCTGRGEEGQLGNGISGLAASRSQFLFMAGSAGAERMTVGRFSTCVVLASGPFCTGANESGQLGVGDTQMRLQLTPLLSPIQ